MGLLDKIFSGHSKADGNSASRYRTFTETSPVFTSFDGAIYEQELTRAAIERFASACSKLNPEITGSASSAIARAIHTEPNPVMTWSAFLKRLATIYEVDGTAAVVPMFSPDYRIIGFFPMKFQTAEVIDLAGEPWVRFYLATGDTATLRLSEVAFLSKFQYYSDIFGEHNCIGQTMELIHAQSEAQENAIKNGAKIRFIGALNGQVRPEDIETKRKEFIGRNLTSENNGGILVYDQTWSSIQQIEPQSYTISDAEMKRIEDNVCTYFGTNTDILQNRYDEDAWAAYYEGKVEPFAIQLGDGLTKMCFSDREKYSAAQGRKNRIMFSSNRLQYASMASKRNMIRDLVDRGIMSINEAREILQLPPVDGGDIRVIRGEYINTEAVSRQTSQLDSEDEPTDSDSDGNRGDSDSESEE